MFFVPLTSSEPGEPHRWEPPAWVQPPAGILPAIVPVTRVLGRTAHGALALRGIEVFPDGVRILLRAIVVRGDLDRRAWRDLTDDVSGHPYDADLEGLLRIGLSYPDGTRADMKNVWPQPEGTPDGPVLTFVGGGGGGGDDRYEMDRDVWLWPAPPAGPLTLHFRWDALDIPEGSIELDGAALDAARGRAVPIFD